RRPNGCDLIEVNPQQPLAIANVDGSASVRHCPSRAMALPREQPENPSPDEIGDEILAIFVKKAALAERVMMADHRVNCDAHRIHQQDVQSRKDEARKGVYRK